VIVASRRSLFLAFLAFFAVVVAAPPARASEADGTARWAHSIAVDGVVGLGTPVGFGGVDVEYTPVPWLTLSAGLGANAEGAQEALGARLRGIPRPGVAMAFGVGASTGPYATVEPLIAFFDDPQQHYRWTRAYWLNVDFSIERRWDNGLEMRWFLGLASLLNSSATSCISHDPEAGNGEDRPCSTDAPRDVFAGFIPYFGYALGFASPL
jgi:hypothetical protein